jgi:S1-C subfamily serine protease
MATKQSLYEILGVDPDANELDIGLAFQRRTFELKREAGADPNAMGLVQQAHEVLSNAQRRAAYDASRVTAAEKDAAKLQAQSPDLEVDEDEEASARPKWMFPALGAVVLLVIVGYFVTRSKAPPPAEKPEVVAEAAKPEPPAPPKPLTSEQMLARVTRAAGPLMSYDMSGNGVPVGIAVSYESGTVVTTCHGLSAGAKPVFRQGPVTTSAELTIVDEVLDLCRLNIVGSEAKTLAIAQETPKAGDKVFTLAVDANGGLAITDGVVKGVGATPEGKIIELSMKIEPNASGAPVLDPFGRVVGVATAPHKFSGGINAAIAASSIPEMRSRARPQ